MRSYFLRYGISALAFAAATDAGGGTSEPVDYSALHRHEDADAALGDTPKPEGWDKMRVSDKAEWLTKNKPQAGETANAPTAVQTSGTAGDATTIAEATKDATTEENPASTTRADDPERDSTFSGTTTAEQTEGVQQEPNSNDEGAAAASGQVDTDLPEEPTRGNRHSHAAETTAERTERLAAGESTVDAQSGGTELLAGESADPAKQPQPGDQPKAGESSQDESGAIQDATRQAIGAGTGAPDGITGPGADPSEPEINALADQQNGQDDDLTAEIAPGSTIRGTKVKLWRLLEKGATHAEMLEATGYRSAIGTAQSLAQTAKRGLVSSTNDNGEKVYKLGPAHAETGSSSDA